MSPDKSPRSHYRGCVTSFIAHPGNSRVGSLCSVYVRGSMAMQGPHRQQEPPGSSQTSSHPLLSTVSATLAASVRATRSPPKLAGGTVSRGVGFV